MSILVKKHQILEILVANLSTPQPQVIHSAMIAAKLKMSVQETCQLVKVMDEMGMLVSDMEGQKSLITRKGLAAFSETNMTENGAITDKNSSVLDQPAFLNTWLKDVLPPLPLSFGLDL